MPSPFPGMDPYLEDRSLWPDVHQRLIAYISEALQPQVRPKSVARIGERINEHLPYFSQYIDLRIGTASDHPISVRALAYGIAGHELHHVADFRQRYRV